MPSTGRGVSPLPLLVSIPFLFSFPTLPLSCSIPLPCPIPLPFYLLSTLCFHPSLFFHIRLLPFPIHQSIPLLFLAFPILLPPLHLSTFPSYLSLFFLQPATFPLVLLNIPPSPPLFPLSLHLPVFSFYPCIPSPLLPSLYLPICSPLSLPLTPPPQRSSHACSPSKDVTRLELQDETGVEGGRVGGGVDGEGERERGGKRGTERK